jgi:hypothetical protein
LTSAFKGKTNNKNSGSIILKSWNRSSNSSRSKILTGNILEYAHEIQCQESSGVESEQGYAVLIGFPTVEAWL